MDLTGFTKAELRQRLCKLKGDRRKIYREWKPHAKRAEDLGKRLVKMDLRIQAVADELEYRKTAGFNG